LLQRFYDPDAGHILLDVQKSQLRWLRQQMGLVSQEPSLFNDTIGATESDVVAAARLANAHTFISSLHQVLYCLAPEQSTFISTGTDVFPVILPQIPESAPPPGMLQGPQISSDPPAPAPEKPTATRIEVCMGGKCKKSGSLSLLQELENKVGTGRRLQVLGEVRLRSADGSVETEIWA
jgi:hypothetical protein